MYVMYTSAANVNSLTLNNMFKADATVFQKIMKEANGTKPEDIILAISKTVL
jgi:hypothetical protein